MGTSQARHEQRRCLVSAARLHFSKCRLPVTASLARGLSSLLCFGSHFGPLSRRTHHHALTRPHNGCRAMAPSAPLFQAACSSTLQEQVVALATELHHIEPHFGRFKCGYEIEKVPRALLDNPLQCVRCSNESSSQIGSWHDFCSLTSGRIFKCEVKRLRSPTI